MDTCKGIFKKTRIVGPFQMSLSKERISTEFLEEDIILIELNLLKKEVGDSIGIAIAIVSGCFFYFTYRVCLRCCSWEPCREVNQECRLNKNIAGLLNFKFAGGAPLDPISWDDFAELWNIGWNCFIPGIK